MNKLVLSGDIGGTNTRLQLTQFQSASDFNILTRESYPSGAYRSINEIIATFFKDSNTNASQIDSICFAVAGPIVDGKVKFTNLPWFIDAERLKKDFNTDNLKLINDFEAIGYGIATLDKDGVTPLQAGKPQKTGPISLIGAGTGLGIALVHHLGDIGHSVTATEGGHVDFSPNDQSQMELLAYLRKKHHRVSAERVVSGPGIVNIYKYCREYPLYNQQEDAELHYQVHNATDPAAEIMRHATTLGDPMSLRTIDIFIKCYGAISGNLALTTLPTGGLYVVGGIAPKILPLLKDGRFIDSFTDKGRMTKLLKDIPVTVVLDTNIGLQGAANYGFR